jgi:hypothetical protein
MAEEFNEHSGLEFSCRKVLPPEAIVHDEYLQYCVRDIVHALLTPLEEEVFKRVYKETREFLELKRLLPETSEDVYRNYPPVYLQVRYSGDDLDVFRNNMKIVPRFL